MFCGTYRHSQDYIWNPIDLLQEKNVLVRGSCFVQTKLIHQHDVRY